MVIEGKIVEILPARTGMTEKGEYCFQPIVLEVCESAYRRDGSVFVKDHTILIDISGSYARNFSLPVGTEISIDVLFSCNTYNDKRFQSIRSSYFYVKPQTQQ